MRPYVNGTEVERGPFQIEGIPFIRVSHIVRGPGAAAGTVAQVTIAANTIRTVEFQRTSAGDGPICNVTTMGGGLPLRVLGTGPVLWTMVEQAKRMAREWHEQKEAA